LALLEINDWRKLMSVENAKAALTSLEGKLSDAMSRRDDAEAALLRTEISDAWRHLGLAEAKARLAGLESKLADAMSRRDKTAIEIASIGADCVGTRGRNSAMKLPPLNRLAKSIDADIALLRIEIRHAQQALKLQEAAAENVKTRQAAANGATQPRLVQLEIRAPDGRVLRQWHKSVDAARMALSPGYEITGEVIGGGVVSPTGPGARPFMKALLDSQGDVLMEWLAERGIIGADKTVVILPNNNREPLQ
jgi:hypothetical protein